jgi:TatD DNase family protein
MLIDAHAHLDRYQGRLPEALEQIDRHRILTLAMAMDVESYLVTKALAGQSPYIRPAFGIHPWEAPRYAEHLGELDAYLDETTMIGEAGLDFHFVEDESLYGPQRRVFEYQCEWAARLRKPMNLHTKGAEREVLETLGTYGVRECIVHWYSGPPNLVDDYLALGCYFTLGVEVLYSKAIQQIAPAIPGERLLLETDNPGGYEWLVGSPGMPVVLLDVLARVADLREVYVDELESHVAENWRRLEARTTGA